MIREFPSADSIGIDFTMAKAADSNSGFERIFYIYFYKKKQIKLIRYSEKEINFISFEK